MPSESTSTDRPARGGVGHSRRAAETSVASVSRYCSVTPARAAALADSSSSPHRQRAAPRAGGLYVPSASRPVAWIVTSVPPAVGPPEGERAAISLFDGSR